MSLDTSSWTQSDARAWCDALSEYTNDWQGVPVPLGADTPIVVHPDHPLFDFYRSAQSWECSDDDVNETERVVNHWFSRARQCDVYVVERDGRYSAVTIPIPPDRAMHRLTFWLSTMGACDAWDLAAEHTARETLQAMLSDRQWMHYDMTGSFFETSSRSGLTYVFRRLRPTIALSPRALRPGDDHVRCIAVLCLHPIGYYANSWAGCMVPSDDVIAHLSWMRGDEAGYWKQANQHAPHTAEAGL